MLIGRYDPCLPSRVQRLLRSGVGPTALRSATIAAPLHQHARGGPSHYLNGEIGFSGRAVALLALPEVREVKMIYSIEETYCETEHRCVTRADDFEHLMRSLSCFL